MTDETPPMFTMEVSQPPQRPPALATRVPLGDLQMEVLGVEHPFHGLNLQMRDIQRKVIHAAVMNDEMDCMRRVLAYLIEEAGGWVAIPLSVFPGRSPEDPGTPELTVSNNGRGVVHIAVVPRPADRLDRRHGHGPRTAFATGSVTLSELAGRVKALIDDLHNTAGHGLIGT